MMDSSSVHHQKFFTVHTAMVYVCWQLASRIGMELQFQPDPVRKLSANLYDTYHCCVYSEKLLMMDSSSVHHQEFFTVHTAMVYVCWQLASRIRMELQFQPDTACKLSANLYDIYHCCVISKKLLMMDRGTVRNIQNFIPNKLEKLVHLVGFITRKVGEKILCG